MKRVLVTGANGFVGTEVVRELLSQNYDVRALHRAGASIESISSLNCERVIGDVKDAESLGTACEGIDTVIHIAALFREAKHPDSEYHKVNVEGVKNLFDAAIEKGVTRVIHCSTVGVHSHIPNPPADESEAFRPADIYQETKLAGEKVARSYFESGKMNGGVIRPAMIWGPGDRRTLKLYKGIAERKFPMIGSGKTLAHWILVSDLARAFRVFAEREDLNNEVFIIAGEKAVTLNYLVETIAQSFDVKGPALKVPALPVQLLGDLCELMCKPFGIEPPIYRRRVDFFTKTRSFSTENARKLLNFTPELSFEQEVKRISEWYQNNDWISVAQKCNASESRA